jgi:predicted cupin superfamily sugar epimerase
VELIRMLDLRPHPEGGHYREIFRSVATVKPQDDRDVRSALTTIYFLLTAGAVSRWHQVRSDEVWHLYEGGPLELLDLDLTTRRLDTYRLGGVSTTDARPVRVIEAGHWQAARSLGPYALMGCTVGPGFDFSDFRLMADDESAAQTVRETWPALSTFI